MLDMLIKENLGNSAAVFNVDQHDAAEANSTNGELKNIVTQQGGVLTALVDFATDDEYMVNKAVIAAGGWIMPRLSASATEVVFTAAAAGVNNFPTIEQFADKLLTFQSSASSNTGAYTVDYDGDGGLPLVDANGVPLTPGVIPSDTLVQIFYDSANVEWVLKTVVGNAGFYVEGNAGVVFAGNIITDFCSDTRNFQLGARGILSAEDSPDFDVSFGYNSYCKVGSLAGEFEKIATGEWAGRSLWDVANGRYVLEYSLAADLDSDFTFRDGWGMTEFGDFFQGENASVIESSDVAWTYTWFPKNKVAARSKTVSADDITFRGTNIYPTGAPPTMNVIATGDWEFTVESSSGGKSWYKGNGTALDTFLLSSIPGDIISRFIGGDDGVKNVSFKAPIAIGSLMTGAFLDADTKMVQNQLGDLSNLQTSRDTFLYDIWGSGFYSQLLFGEDSSDLSFGDPSTTYNQAVALSFTRGGTVFSLGNDSTLPTDSRRTIRSPDGSLSTLAFPVSEVPLSAVNNQAEDTMFLSFSSGASPTVARSVDNGINWETFTVGPGALPLGGLSRFNDGTICVVHFGGAGISPTPSTNTGGLWMVGLAVPDIDYDGVTPGFGNAYATFERHPDGEIFYAGPAVTTGQMVIYEAASITTAWSLVGNVDGASAPGDLGCLFIDQNTGAIYVGMEDSSGRSSIRRSMDKGVSFTTVYTGSDVAIGLAFVTKIIQTPEGILFAIVRETSTESRIIRSTDAGLSWESIHLDTPLMKDLIHVPTDNAIYVLTDNIGAGFIVDRYPLQIERATAGNSLPTKITQAGGGLEVSIAEDVVDVSDQISFGIPVFSVVKKAIGILKNIGSAIVASEAAIGGLFRNADDNNYLWAKELDGSTYPLNGSLTPQQIHPADWAPNLANVGALLDQTHGAGATEGAFRLIDFKDTGADFYYTKIFTPRSWVSRKLRFRVSYIINAAIALPAVIGWELSLRRLESGLLTGSNSWIPLTLEDSLSDTNILVWRQTAFSGIIELPAFDPAVDALNVRISRDTTVTNNELDSAYHALVEIQWEP